ncbi:hypothetical protein MLD38_025979 [Melastoma candidum]|uniref:Uncharacterized protein n=2 Tax=Melastoma candidum TaxID=119954 RepID=A0ACB9NX46_9MYRT|nr:hypothetical protein MLD38_025979 [Melastoma candidum]
MVMTEEPEFHVLAVDDSLLDRKLIERLLRTSSCQVTTVDSGSKALEFLGVHEDDSSSPDSSPSVSSSEGNHQVVEVDLVITDYCMPGMTGYDLLKKIKESSSLRNIPVVIMSSENVPSRISRCLEEGAEEFFLKPVRQSDLSRLKPHMMKTKLKDRTRREEVVEERGGERRETEIEPEASQQQHHQQQQLLSNNNTTKRKAMDEVALSPDRTRPRYADIAAVV